MTDLTERLRRYKRDRSGYAEYCHQAADEIDRLRTEVAEYQNASIDLADAAVSLAERMRAHLSPEDIATVVRLRDLLAARKAAP